MQVFSNIKELDLEFSTTLIRAAFFRKKSYGKHGLLVLVEYHKINSNQNSDSVNVIEINYMSMHDY